MREAFIVDYIRTPIGRFGGVAGFGARRRSRRRADEGAASRAIPGSTRR